MFKLSVPIYPGAQQVQIQDPAGGGVPRRVVKFQVDDKPEEVLAFYKKILEQDGWQAAQTTPAYRTLDYSWNNCEYPRYWLLGDIQAKKPGETSVELDIRTIYGE